jgi:hypothetical protein
MAGSKALSARPRRCCRSTSVFNRRAGCRERQLHVPREDAYSQRKWAAEICRLLASAIEIREIDPARCPPHLLRFSRISDPEIPMIVDSRRLRRHLGYTEKGSRSDGLRRTVEARLKAGRPRGLEREYRLEDRMLYGWTYRFRRAVAGKRPPFGRARA